jgi:two-component system cell cycle response regulator
MSLQRRLTLFFVLIVIVPLAAAGFVVNRVIVDESGRRAVLSLHPALDVTVALYNERLDRAEPSTQAAVESEPDLGRMLQTEDVSAIENLFERELRASAGLDFLLASTPDGEPLAFASNPSSFVPGQPEPTGSDIEAAAPGGGRGFYRTAPIPIRVEGVGQVGAVIGGLWLDEDLLAAATRTDVELSFAHEGTIFATTAPLSGPARIDVNFDDTFDAEIGEPAMAEAVDLSDGLSLVASTPSAANDSLARRVLTSLVVLIVFAMLGITALAYLLARLITQPLEELARGANLVSEGYFDYEFPARSSRDEVGRLADAFRDMTRRLRQTINQLSSSRDQLQRAVMRTGQTLRSTHDMNQMIESILSTTADAVEADAAILWRFTPTRDELYPAIGQGVTVDQMPRLKVGEGMVGHVGERATALVMPPESASDGGLRYARQEPAFPMAAAVPLYTQDRIIGVLAAYRRDLGRRFTREDLDTMTFLVEQGGVAIENVLLHEEAQRLSITDGLTGTWNRRYLYMQFKQVLATAQRFDRLFSVLMLDLDNFKDINDNYGHQRGDAILVEFSHRVSTMLREVDTFARYGGEEFVCLLSETDEDGAITTAEKIRDSVKSEPFGGMDEHLLNVTVSIGIAAYPQHGESAQTLIESADRALYQAKQTGRDRVTTPEGLLIADAGEPG